MKLRSRPVLRLIAGVTISLRNVWEGCSRAVQSIDISRWPVIHDLAPVLLLRKAFGVGAKSARAESKGPPSTVVPAIHDLSTDDLSRFELDAEVGAEEYFIQAQGQTAIGFFEPTTNVSFAHEEAEWEVADLLADRQRSPRQAMGTASSPSALHISVDRLRTEAETRRWLSPKSRSALAKLTRGDTNLAISELNALDYLLARATGISRLATDIERIQNHVTNRLDGIG